MYYFVVCVHAHIHVCVCSEARRRSQILESESQAVVICSVCRELDSGLLVVVVGLCKCPLSH